MSLRADWFTQLEEPRKITASTPAPIDTPGRLLALDLGAKRIGVAISDELRITTRPLPVISRRSWKDLLRQVEGLVEMFAAKALVIGLPLRLDGGEGDAAENVRTVAEKFRRSLGVPIYLQDERLTTFAANSELRAAGLDESESKREVDSEAAAIILRDFIDRMQSQTPHEAN